MAPPFLPAGIWLLKEFFDARHHLGRSHGWAACGDARVLQSLQQGISPEIKDNLMTIDLWLAGITALGLLTYLVAVLVRPERF